MYEGIVIDIESIESKISGKTLEVKTESFDEEWKTIDAVSSAYKAMTRISEDFNGTIEDFSSFLASLKDNESSSYYPDVLNNKGAIDAVDREEAVGYYMLTHPKVDRSEAEATVDYYANYTSYEKLAKGYGSSVDAEAMEEMNNRVASSRAGLARDVAANASMRAHGEDRASAEQRVDEYYSNGSTYEGQTSFYRSLEETNRQREDTINLYQQANRGSTREEARAAVDGALKSGQSLQSQQNKYARGPAIEKYMEANPGSTRETAEEKVDSFYDNGNSYVDQLSTYDNLIQLHQERNTAIERYMEANPGSTRETAEERVDSFYDNGNSYVAQLGTYDREIAERNGQ